MKVLFGFLCMGLIIACTDSKMNAIKEQNETAKIDSVIQGFDKDSFPEMKIITKLSFDNRPLIYVASDLHKDYYGKYEYGMADFYLLDSTYLWILEQSDVNPEYVVKKAGKSLPCTDETMVISPSDIKIINFDSACINGEKPEILIRLYGPSSDDAHYLLGYDSKGNLEILIKDVFIQNYTKVSDSIVRFESVDRYDRIGTEFFTNEYHFNSVTKKAQKITQPEYKHTIRSTTRDTVSLYKSYSSAVSRNNDSVLVTLLPGSQVFITSYLDKPDGWLIQHAKQSGWIYSEQLFKFNVGFAD